MIDVREVEEKLIHCLFAGFQCRLTDCGFAELLVCHLAGDVGPHQHADLDLQLLPDDVRDELQPVWSLVDALDKNNNKKTVLKLLHFVLYIAQIHCLVVSAVKCEVRSGD